MLTQKQILEYAIKGITAEIHQLEKDVREGYRLVEQIDNGERAKTTKTRYEILDIVGDKKAEMKRLDKERFDLSWIVDVDMKDEE